MSKFAILFFNQYTCRMLLCNSLDINYRNIILLVFVVLVLPFSVYGQSATSNDTPATRKEMADSLKSQTVDSVSIKKNKSQKTNKIDTEIDYSAKDSVVFLGTGVGFLHGESDIQYKKINLKADYVRISMDSSLVFARGTTDSLGLQKGEPVFSEGDQSYTSKEMTYNLKTKKGYIRQAVTQEGEGYIISDKTKKTDDDEFCMTGGKYTTCDNHDHPDFYLSMSKGKVKPGEYVVTGPAHLVVADVPLPLFIPFGFFPFTNDYSSGIIMPTYADELSRGLGLLNGGYYFALSDYADLQITGDIYTKGTWSVDAKSTYRKKYKYSGNFDVEYREDVTGEKDLTSDYSKLKSFKITWSHSQDAKADPYFTFSSSVNFSTSGYQKNNINYYAQGNLNSQNTKSSTVSFTKKFADIPSLSITGGISATQRTSDSTINMTLPNLSIAYSRFYPFKRKNAVGKERWYEKISMSYSGSMANTITTKEDQLLNSSFKRDWYNGMKHSIPVSATFNILKYINISPYFNYNERWYLQTYNKTWDATNGKEIVDTTYNFSRTYDFNMGVSASTKLYGFYEPIRSIFGNKVDRIRHVLTPSIGFGYTPDFSNSIWGFYGMYEKIVDNVSTPVKYYKHTTGFGTPSTAESGSINFSLANNLEMKVRNDNDTTGKEAFKKISLIDNFTVSGSYNMVADSMNWSVFAASLRLKLSKSYSLSLSTTFDPYMYGLNSAGNPVRINELRWEHGGFPRFQGTSTSYSYTLNNDTFKKLFGKGDDKKNDKKGGGPDDQNNTDNTNDVNGTTDGSRNGQNQGGNNKKTELDADGYEKVEIPWSVSLSYTVSYRNTSEFDYNKMEYKMGFTHSLSMSGNMSLTSNWKFTFNPTFDINTRQFTYLSMTVNRSLHCWSMSASVVPFGVYRSYSFHIGVNSSMLSDLKYDQQSDSRQNNITWY